MMTSLAKGDTSPVNIVRLVLCSFGFLALGVFLAIKVFPHLPPLLSRIPGSKYASVPQLVGTLKCGSLPQHCVGLPRGPKPRLLTLERSRGQRGQAAHRPPPTGPRGGAVAQAASQSAPTIRVVPSLTHQVQPRDEVHIFLMVATLSVCAYITAIKEAADGGAFIGSHLLGAFVAGMCFVNVPRSQQIWNSQMKRVVKWMVRFFFAASVGFAVPVSEMFTWDAFGNGLLLAIGPTIATKVVVPPPSHTTTTTTIAFLAPRAPPHFISPPHTRP